MNHDYAHCLDYTENCPKECFRAQLQRDIEEHRSEFVGVPLTYARLGGTIECKLVKDKYVTYKMELSCDGCKFVGTYNTDFPCSRCIRREKDYYEQER